MSKRVLGRGLSALVSDKTQIVDKSHIFESNVHSGVIKIPIDKIKTNKYQPREDFDPETIKELAISIKEKGLIQPIVVRLDQEDYELIAGERRLRAAKLINLTEVPAIVKEVSDLDSLELSIIENVQREDLNPIDQAKAYKRLSDEFNITQENIADVIGKNRATVANILRLLKLPEKIQEYVSRGTISMGHAKAILGFANETDQHRLCTKIIKDGLSVRETEQYTKKIGDSTKQQTKDQDPDLSAVEQGLRELLGTKVRIIKSKKGGRIEIEFYSESDLEKIITLLKTSR